MAKTTVLEVDKTTQKASIIGELKEGTQTVLRNIQVGDDLSGKTLYMNFPSGLHTQLSSGGTFIGTDGDYKQIDSYNNYSGKGIIARVGSIIFLYNYDLNTLTENFNRTTYTLPTPFGVVNSINSSHPAYQYIKIEVPTTKQELTTDGNFEAKEFIEDTTFQIKSDGTVEAGEFIEQ